MIFNSIYFIFVYLPITLFLYYLVVDQAKKYVLLFASLFFYLQCGWIAVYVLIGYAFLIWFLGVVLSKFKLKELLLILVVISLVPLLLYKYHDFFKVDFTDWGIIHLLGLSFITFKAISYLVECYQDTIQSKPNIFGVMLYLLNFMQVSSGPIELAHNYFKPVKLEVDNINLGLQRFIVGLSKKVIIADSLGTVSTGIFTDASLGLDATTAWIGILTYTMQLYFDFSGYSDMAIGLGKMFGFEFLDNFNYPYLSSNINEFWQRWHMSLNRWLIRYLYIPLGGSKVKWAYWNVILMFLVSGIWHGSTLNFIVWGLFHGILAVITRFIKHKSWYQAIPKPFHVLVTFFLVMMGWVIFNTTDLSQAGSYLSTLLFGSNQQVNFGFQYYLSFKNTVILIMALVLSFVRFDRVKNWLRNHQLVQDVLLMGLFLICFVFLINYNFSTFIYFQF